MAVPARHPRFYDPRRGLQRRTARVNRRLLDCLGVELMPTARIGPAGFEPATCRRGDRNYKANLSRSSRSDTAACLVTAQNINMEHRSRATDFSNRAAGI